MATEIKIHGNGLRLLNRFFLAVVPLKVATIQTGTIYNCELEGFGNMGEIECVRVSSMELGHFDDRLNMLADYKVGYKESYKNDGLFLTDKLQIGYFRFKRRIDQQFIKLLEKESKAIGLNLNPQPSLFEEVRSQ